MVMDGGESEKPESDADREPTRSLSILAARAAADAEALESDPFLHDLFSRMSALLDELADVRWAPRGPHVVAAAARRFLQQQARLDAHLLRLLHEVEIREDVVPRVRTGVSRSAAFLRGAARMPPAQPGTPLPPGSRRPRTRT